MVQSRRSFLILGSLVAGGTLVLGSRQAYQFFRQNPNIPSDGLNASPTVQPEWSGFAIAHGKRELGKGNFFASPRIDQKGMVLIGNYAGTQIKEYKTNFVSHQIIQNPKRRTQFFGIQKWGLNAISMNLENDEVTALELPEHHYFFGHGFCTLDGDFVLISAMDMRSAEGQLLVFETRSLKLVNKYRTYGVNPHDVQLSHDHKNILLIHGGNLPDEMKKTSQASRLNSCMTRLSADSGDLISHIELDSGTLAYGHFLNIDDQQILCLGLQLERGGRRSLPPALAFLTQDRVEDLMVDSSLKSCEGEALSARLVDASTALVTLPDSNTVVLFDFKQKNVKKTFFAQQPRGVARLPTGDFLVSQSRQEKPFLVYKAVDQVTQDLQTYFQSPGEKRSSWVAVGAHMTEIAWPEF